MFIFTPTLTLFPFCLTLAPLSRPPSPSLYSDTKISYKISFFFHTFTTASRMLSDSSPFHWKGWLLGILILVIRGTWNKKYEYSPLFQDPGSQSPVSLSTNSLMGGGIGVVVRGNEGLKGREDMCCCCLMISIKEETRYLFSELWSWRDWYSCGSGYRNCSIGRWQGRPWSGAGMCAMRSECSGSQSRVKLEFPLEVVALRSWPLEPSRWHCMLESYFINYEINMPLPGTRNPMCSFLWNSAGCDTLCTPPPKLSLLWRRTLSLHGKYLP